MLAAFGVGAACAPYRSPLLTPCRPRPSFPLPRRPSPRSPPIHSLGQLQELGVKAAAHDRRRLDEVGDLVQQSALLGGLRDRPARLGGGRGGAGPDRGAALLEVERDALAAFVCVCVCVAGGRVMV